ncbi:MAG: hypothetical protein JW864_17710 [Spirochaetes bacterium]|nr:hypothetical protein [Spirochaetota bacterium]
MKIIRKTIEISGSMTFAKYLLGAITLVLFTGSLYYQIDNEIFIPLNYLGMFEWINTFGFENPAYTWWFLVFVLLMVLLGINTFACTIDRLLKIFSKFRNIKSIKSKIFLLAPHIMHFSFIVLMLGYFSLYAFGINTYNNILRPGISGILPGTEVKMEIKDHRFMIYSGEVNENFKGIHIDAEFDLSFTDNGKEVIKTTGLNSPCFYKGYSIHLADFNPKSARGMTKTVWANLTIRKNAGIPLFIAGVIIFVTGVFLYAASTIESGKDKLKDNRNKE